MDVAPSSRGSPASAASSESAVAGVPSVVGGAAAGPATVGVDVVAGAEEEGSEAMAVRFGSRVAAALRHPRARCRKMRESGAQDVRGQCRPAFSVGTRGNSAGGELGATAGVCWGWCVQPRKCRSERAASWRNCFSRRSAKRVGGPHSPAGGRGGSE